jgi:hypothetical protein
MPIYIVNRNAQDNGDHEVHDRSSAWNCLPDEANRRELGSHDSGASAVRLAQLFYGNANGCATCMVSSHAR